MCASTLASITTAKSLNADWIPVRPGTDTALLLAMANFMITQDCFDQAFIQTYTTGFDKFKAYVTGQEDGVPKTPPVGIRNHGGACRDN